MSNLQSSKASVKSMPFGQTKDGRRVIQYQLCGAGGIRMDVLDYGGHVQHLYVPDRMGNVADITLGFEDVRGYEETEPYFGALIGRFANRIAGGRFELEGKEYSLPLNNAPHGRPCCLHGGIHAFQNYLWQTEPFQEGDSVGLVLQGVSPAGDQGFPGTLKVKITYLLTAENLWRVDYEAQCDAVTPVNFTQHIFFNLRGEGNGNILDHRLQLFADEFTPVDSGLIPTGELRPVKGTPCDFTTLRTIGDRIDEADEQLRFCSGYDMNFVLRRTAALSEGGLAPAALLCEDTTGRAVEIATTEPGIQFYSGNFLSEKNLGKSGTPLGRRGGLALETQHFPDSPNHPAFPSTLLHPGETFHSTTTWRFFITTD